MSCWVAYDARDVALHALWLVSIGLLPLAVGLFVSRYHRRKGLFIAAFAVFWMLVGIAEGISSYWSARQALTSGRCSFTEGVVQNFQPMRSNSAYDKAPEQFDAGGRHFKASDRVPVENGKHVRIWHRDGELLRVETCFP